jgi:hypothetical protein
MEDINKFLAKCRIDSEKHKTTTLIWEGKRKIDDMSDNHRRVETEHMFRSKPDWLDIKRREIDARWNSICKLNDDWKKDLIKEDFVKSEIERITHVKKHYF